MFDLESVPYFPLKLEESPEGWTYRNPLTAIESKLNGTAVHLLELCNGYLTFDEIITELEKGYQTSRAIVTDTAFPILEKLAEDGMLWWRKRRMNIWNLPPPMAVLWDITGNCNLHCAHCVVNSTFSSDIGLSFEECQRLVDEMAAFGVRQLIISGGEPTLRPDFLDICSYAVKKGLSIQVATNATRISKRIATALSNLGVMAQVSLDAPVANIHDDFRQTPGAWKRCLTGLKRLLAAGVQVTLAATVTTDTIQDIPALYEFAAGLGVSTFRILPFVPGGRGANSRHLEVSPEQMRKLTLLLHKRRAENKLPIAPMEFECTLLPPLDAPDSDDLHIGCDGAIAYCTITPSGDILPCNFFPGMDVENIRNHSFEWIWRNSRFLNYFRSLVIGDIQGHCQNCDWLGTCRGSCIAANFAYGNIFQSNCHCWLANKEKAGEASFNISVFHSSKELIFWPASCISSNAAFPME